MDETHFTLSGNATFLGRSLETRSTSRYAATMQIVFYIGIACALAGLAGVVVCILRALPLRKATQDDGDVKAALQRLVFWNAAAFGIAFLGLGMIVVAGLLS